MASPSWLCLEALRWPGLSTVLLELSALTSERKRHPQHENVWGPELAVVLERWNPAGCRARPRLGQKQQAADAGGRAGASRVCLHQPPQLLPPMTSLGSPDMGDRGPAWSPCLARRMAHAPSPGADERAEAGALLEVGRGGQGRTTLPLHQLCPRQGFHFSEPQLPHPWDGGDVLLVGVKRGCLRVTAAS